MPETSVNKRTHISKPYEDDHIIVHFAGDDTFDRYRELKDHRNPGYEICLIHFGKGFFKIQDRTYPIGVRQIFMTKAPQVHAGWPARDNPYRILYLCFDIKPAVNGTDAFWSCVRQKLEQISFPIANDRFHTDEIHHRLLAEMKNTRTFSQEMVKTLVQQFILLTLRNYAAERAESAGHPAEAENSLLSGKVMHFINEHIYEKITLDMIGRQLHFSPSYLCRSFKGQTGFTVMEYNHYARLETAKKLLLDTDLPVSLIAEKLGYGSIHHFSNAFKSLYGSSPNAYRKLHRTG